MTDFKCVCGECKNTVSFSPADKDAGTFEVLVWRERDQHWTSVLLSHEDVVRLIGELKDLIS